MKNNGVLLYLPPYVKAIVAAAQKIEGDTVILLLCQIKQAKERACIVNIERQRVRKLV